MSAYSKLAQIDEHTVNKKSKDTLQKLIDKSKGLSFEQFWNEILGKPKRFGKEMGVLSYENMLKETLEHNKLLMVLKPTSSGITEFFLRWLLFKIMTSNEWKDTVCCVIVGTHESLAVRLLTRIRRLLDDKYDIIFDTARNILKINGCEIFTIASKNLNALRSLDKVSCIYISEAEYVPELAEVRQNTERFIAKSNPFIIYESTIKSAVGLYAEILKEEPSIYKKITINYLDALNQGMYDPAMLEKAKKSRSFAKEFLCDVYSLGSVTGTFPATWVRRAFTSNQEIQCNEYYLGCDSGWEPAKTGISLVGKDTRTDIKQIIVCDEYSEDEDSMLTLIVNLKNIFIDAADKRFIKKVKSACTRDPIEYEQYEKYLKHHKILSEYNPMKSLVCCVAVLFTQNSSREMLSYTRNCLEEGTLQIPSTCTTIEKALLSAQDIDGDLIKEPLSKGHGGDALDSLRICLWGMDN